MSKIEGKQIRNLRLGTSQEASPTVGSINFNPTTEEIMVKGSSQNITFLGELSNTLSTTDATLTPILNISISTDSNNLIKVFAEAVRTGGTAGTAGDGGVWERTLRVKNISGVTSIVGTPQSDFQNRDQSTWDVSFDISGTSLRVLVNGATNNNINWKSSATIRTVT